MPQHFKELVSSIGDASLDTTSVSLLISSHIEALKEQLIYYICLKDTSTYFCVVNLLIEHAVEKVEITAGLHDKLIEL